MRAAISPVLLACLIAAGCSDVGHYPPPNLEGGVPPPGTGGPGSGDPDAGATDGGEPDGGGGDAGGYVPACVAVGSAQSNRLTVDGVAVEGGAAYADYVLCPATELQVVLTTESCAAFPASGLYLAIPIDAVGVSVVPGADVLDLIRVAYFDGAGNEFNNDGLASGQVVFDTIGTGSGSALVSLLIDVALPHRGGPDTPPDAVITAQVDLTVARDPADACGP